MQDEHLSDGQSMHATFSFLSGPEHATKAVPTCTASFDYSVSAKFSISSDLLDKLRDEEVLVRLHRGSGHRHTPFGEARTMLGEALRAFADGSGASCLPPALLVSLMPACGLRQSSSRYNAFCWLLGPLTVLTRSHTRGCG